MGQRGMGGWGMKGRRGHGWGRLYLVTNPKKHRVAIPMDNTLSFFLQECPTKKHDFLL